MGFQKYFVFTIVFILFPLAVLSAPVDGDDARIAASAFLNGKMILPAEKLAESLSVNGSECIRNRRGEIVAHVVNLDPEGYVITSADTRIRPILGYSRTGRFDGSESAGNTLLQLIRMDADARFAALNDTGDSDAADRVERNREAWHHAVKGLYAGKAAVDEVWGPLLHSEWYQRSPYNISCPVDPATGIRSVVGCGALAATQILHYWRYPHSLSFDDQDAYVSKGYNGDILIPEDAGKYDFPDFSMLNDALSDIRYDGDMDELAMLLFGVGVKLNMCYSSDVSGTFPSLDFLLNHGYPQSKICVDWSRDYPVAIESIKDHEPILVAVRTLETNDRHAVVFDGYDAGEDMYHINFGWGNGFNTNIWYTVPVMNQYNYIDGFYYDIVPEDAPQFNTVLGTVVDIAGEPVHLASVLIDNGRQRRMTDENGAFTVGLPDFATMHITVQKPGYAFYSGVLAGSDTIITLQSETDPTLAYYHFDGDGTDASGRGNDYRINMDMSSWVDGIYGQALACSNMSFISGARPEIMYPGEGHYTVEAWARLSSFEEQYALVVTVSPLWINLRIDPDAVPTFKVRGDDDTLYGVDGDALSGTYSEGDYVHFAGVYRERESMRLYVDGCLVAEKNVSFLPKTSADAMLFMGWNITHENSPVVMDEVRFTHDALQPGEFIGGEFAGALEVTVTDGRTGGIPDDATVTLEPGGFQSVVDGNGRASFDGIPARDDYTVLVRSQEYIEASRDSVAVATDETAVVSVELTPPVVAVGERQSVFTLRPPWPNPFNAGVTIEYEIPWESDVTLTVFNVIGQKVFSDFRTQAAPGAHTVRWSAEGIPDGLYFVRIRAGEHTSVRKIMHVK